jgi:16S rRNA processing protein RimM
LAEIEPDPEGHVCVGAVAGAFGVQGEVRLKSFCADPEGIGDYGPLIDGAGTAYEVRLDRPVKGGFAARLTGVKTREQAEALKGTRLYAPREALPSLPDDEYYHADLIGLDVVDPSGAPLGRVRAVHDFGAGDLLEVVAPTLRQPALIPFTREAVPTVDLAARRIVADPPEGVFPDAGGRRARGRRGGRDRRNRP